MRLIDVDKADVEMISCYYGGNCHTEDVQEWLNEQPAIDAVEVVRCKDCRFYEENAESRTRFCRRGLNYQYAVPDGFCSYGERKKR